MTTKKCPKCGATNVEVKKTWNLISPFPDREGRITVTIMGVFKCTSCGYTWKGTVSKLKVGKTVEAGIEGKQVILEEVESKPKEIVLDIEDILKEKE